MIFGMTFYETAWIFLVYSFFGWVLEVIFHAVTLGKVINRGFLNGPVCPVYGFGVLAVFGNLYLFQVHGIAVNDLTIFLFGAALATLVELLAGWLLDLCFHAKWWDYSDKPFNFRGYICLEFSCIWGLAVLFVVQIFQKYVERIVLRSLPHTIGIWLLAILFLTYLVDLIVTVATLLSFNQELTRLDKISKDLRIVSDRLSERLAETSIEAAQNIGETKVQAALAKAEFKDTVASVRTSSPEETKEALRLKAAELQKRYEELSTSITHKRFLSRRRLLKAFPSMKHQRYQNLILMLKEKCRED